MCRSIKVLRRPGEPATADQMSKAALQYVRKISGFHKPSNANRDAFERAVLEVANASRQLLEAIGATSAGAAESCAAISGSPQNSAQADR